MRIWRAGAGMGDRGPVEKDRELIKHSDPSFTIARVYGRQGREARRRTAVSDDGSSNSGLMDARSTVSVVTCLGKSLRPGGKKRSLQSGVRNPARSNWVSPVRVRERYDVQPFQADVDFGETPSRKFISDISNAFNVTTALAVDSASVYWATVVCWAPFLWRSHLLSHSILRNPVWEVLLLFSFYRRLVSGRSLFKVT